MVGPLLGPNGQPIKPANVIGPGEAGVVEFAETCTVRFNDQQILTFLPGSVLMIQLQDAEARAQELAGEIATQMIATMKAES